METGLSRFKRNNWQPSRTAGCRKKPNVRVLSSPRRFLHLISSSSLSSRPTFPRPFYRFFFLLSLSLSSFRCPPFRYLLLSQPLFYSIFTVAYSPRLLSRTSGSFVRNGRNGHKNLASTPGRSIGNVYPASTLKMELKRGRLSARRSRYSTR